MLRAAIPIKEIGDLLGHRSANATAVYLKLATEDLRDVALEVPCEGVEQ
jgi:integrase/recombinase XerD